MARRTLNRPRSYANFIRLSLVALLLVGLVAYAGVTLRRYFTVEEVRLPSVVGLPKDEAVALLQSIKLSPVPFTEAVSGAALSTVTSQTPQPGTIVRKGRSVSLGVNEAAAGVGVPGVVGVSQSEAAQRLTAAGLGLGEVTYQFDSSAEGQVVAQSPTEGESVAADAVVSLVVSRGPEVNRVSVPQLRGLNIDAAKNRLRSLGFSNVVTTATGVSFDRPFTVTDQLPSARQAVSPSTQVVLQYTLSTATVAQVPTLNGLSLARAQLLLDASGLALGPVTYIADPAQPGGVVSFEPNGYTLTGSPVGLTLNSAGAPLTDLPTPLNPEGTVPLPPDPAATTSLGEPSATGFAGSSTDASPPSAPGSRTIPFTFDPVQQGLNLNTGDYKFTLKIVDDQGERTLYDAVVGPDETVNLSVTVYGEAQLQIFINDNIYQAWSP